MCLPTTKAFATCICGLKFSSLVLCHSGRDKRIPGRPPLSPRMDRPRGQGPRAMPPQGDRLVQPCQCHVLWSLLSASNVENSMTEGRRAYCRRCGNSKGDFCRTFDKVAKRINVCVLAEHSWIKGEAKWKRTHWTFSWHVYCNVITLSRLHIMKKTTQPHTHTHTHLYLKKIIGKSLTRLPFHHC